MKTTTLHLTGLAALSLLVLSLLPFVSTAQEQTQTTAIEVEARQEANYNNSRSNRANISVSGETNVCDGVTCPDGSCAATGAECATTAGAAAGIREGGQTIDAGTVPERAHVDALDDDSDGDGLDDGTEGASYNNSRSNRSTVRDADSDDDGLADGTEAARGVDEDCDDDESCVRPGETNRAQDYNATRSNKPSRAIFADTTGSSEVRFGPNGFERKDGTSLDVKFKQVATTVARTQSNNDTNDTDGKVYCWGEAEDDAGRVYSWGRGLCVALAASENANETARQRLTALQVTGDELRGWSDEEKEAWNEYRQNRATTSAEERLLERMVEKTQANERIQEMSADDEEVGMEYQADIRLFGIIPLQRTVNARATAAGEVAIDYPWYRFLSRVPEQTEIQNTLTELQSLLVAKELDKASPKLAE